MPFVPKTKANTEEENWKARQSAQAERQEEWAEGDRGRQVGGCMEEIRGRKIQKEQIYSGVIYLFIYLFWKATIFWRGSGGQGQCQINTTNDPELSDLT